MKNNNLFLYLELVLSEIELQLFYFKGNYADLVRWAFVDNPASNYFIKLSDTSWDEYGNSVYHASNNVIRYTNDVNGDIRLELNKLNNWNIDLLISSSELFYGTTIATATTFLSNGYWIYKSGSINFLSQSDLL